MLEPQIYAAAFELNPDGKKCMDELCTLFLNRLSHVRGDPMETAFNEGRKALLLFIKQQINAAQNPQQGEEEHE